LVDVMARATASSAENYLGWALAAGHIFGYGRLDGERGERVRWRIEVQPTRYAAHHDPDARGVIVLTTREVMAFVEGLWAATKTQPTTRAGAPSGSAIADFEASTR
jgi:hypothetical protein